MITALDFYNVMSKVLPLYVAMFLGYGSVKWWDIIPPNHCPGISTYVSYYAVPFYQFTIIASNNLYKMNWSFILGDSLQKIIVLILLFLWCKLYSRSSLDWAITLYALSTLPNTLVMGVPLLSGMYGPDPAAHLMVQVVVMQCIVWYTILLILFEYRAGKLLIAQRFPDTLNSIASIKVDSDIVSLAETEVLETEAEIKEDGKIHVKLRKSTSVRSGISVDSYNDPPRLSNMSCVEIYSIQSSRRISNVNESDNFYYFGNGGNNFRSASVGNSRFDMGRGRGGVNWASAVGSKSFNGIQEGGDGGGGGGAGYPGPSIGGRFSSTQAVMYKEGDNGSRNDYCVNTKFSKVYEDREFEDSDNYGKNMHSGNEPEINKGTMRQPLFLLLNSSKKVQPEPEPVFKLENIEQGKPKPEPKPTGGPSTIVMFKLIATMVVRKLMRNPNTYASLIGIVWSLISFRYNVKFPAIIDNSIQIMANTGMGIAMFSLGMFMALQPQIIAGGYKKALFAGSVRFFVGPLIAAAGAAIAGLRGEILRISVVQASLPEGILPFVFAKQFNVHPEIMSTAVMFGMIISVPIAIVYNIVVGYM